MTEDSERTTRVKVGDTLLNPTGKAFGVVKIEPGFIVVSPIAKPHRKPRLDKKKHYNLLNQNIFLWRKASKDYKPPVQRKIYRTYRNSGMRRNHIIQMHQQGESLQSIGDMYDISRQRVHQIIVAEGKRKK